MRSTHMYKHITSPGIFKVHVPHPNTSSASTVSDQPSPLTATCLNINNFSPVFKLQKLCEWGTELGCVARVRQELPTHETVNTCAPTMKHQNEVLGQNAEKAKIYLFRDSQVQINKAWAFILKIENYPKHHYNLRFCFLFILSNSVGISPRNRDEQMQGGAH